MNETIADFRARIAAMLRDPSAPQRFPNSCSIPELVRKPHHPGFNPPQHPLSRKQHQPNRKKK